MTVALAVQLELPCQRFITTICVMAPVKAQVILLTDAVSVIGLTRFRGKTENFC